MKHTKQNLKSIGLLLSVIGLIAALSQVQRIQTLFTKAARQPANLIVDTGGVTGRLKQPWLNYAQGGEGTWFSTRQLSDQLTPLQPQYIRIDHLYDVYVRVTKDNGGLRYDFSKLDNLLAEMKSVGAVPFISLSYMPDFLNGDITGAPASWDEYQQVIQQTIEHISGTNGLNIANVYYEVWNEPDLFGEWKTYGDKNYLNLYRSAAQAAANVRSVKPFKLGGPGTTKLYDNWIDALLTMVQAENLRLDFYSWHHYNTDPQAYISDVERLKEKMRNYPELALKVEYVISEWGIDSENNPAYDTLVSAAHLVASVVSFPPNLSKAFIFEIQDGKSPEGKEHWGRWGMFTHPDFGSKPKPRARALHLLNQLGSEQLSVVGQGSWVKALAAKKGAAVQLLVANYDQDNQHAETVPVTLKRIEPGNYLISTTYLGRSKTTERIRVDSGSYAFTIPLPPNNVVLYELTPEN